MFVQNAKAHTALKVGELVVGQNFVTGHLYRLQAVRECILDRSNDFVVAWIEHVHHLLLRGDFKRAMDLNVGTLKGSKTEHKNSPGLVGLCSMRIMVADHVFCTVFVKPICA